VGKARKRSIDPLKLLCTALLALVAAVFIYPVFLNVVTSFKSEDAVIANPLSLPTDPSLDAYVTVWRLLGLDSLMLNSLLYSAAGTGFALVLAIFPAYAFSRFRFPGRRTTFILLLTTLMLPQQAVVIPLYRLLTEMQLLNTRPGLIIVHAGYGMAYELLLIAGYMASLPKELEEAARVEGCSDWGVLRHVVLPLSVPAMVVAFLLNFIGIWKEFLFALTFVSSQSAFPMTVGVLKLTVQQYFTEFPLPAAAVVLAQLPMLLVFLVAHRWLTQGIYTGAVKA
jgi:raffinose/stachyose/melibiose transport system permease protein